MSESLDASPHLDDALAALSERDRQLVLTRFFERLPFNLLGPRFGLSPDAARKRVERSLERMRVYLHRRGLLVSAASLAATVSEATSAPPSADVAAIVAQLRIPPGSPTNPPGGQLAPWVEGALADWKGLLLRQQWTRVAWGTMASAAGLAMVLLLKPFAAPSPAPPRAALAAPMLQTSEPPPIRAPAKAGQASPAGQLTLRFVDARTSMPLPATEVVVETWDQHGFLRADRLRSGSHGECELRNRDPRGRMLRVWASAASHVPVVMDWHVHELVEGFPAYECRLEPGQTLTGTVHDPTGSPVANAIIRFQEPGLDTARRENIGFRPETTQVATDAEGRFRSDQMPTDWVGSPLGISIRHPDFVGIDYQVSGPQAWTSNHAVVLTSGLPLRGEVFDLHGAPIASATLRANRGGAWPEEASTTDNEGRFVFAHLPSGSFPFRVQATGFESHDGLVHVSETNDFVRVRLRPSPPDAPAKRPNDATRSQALNIEVRDARTGIPIPRFRVLLNTDGGGQPTLLGEGIQGLARWTVDASYYTSFHLEIEAPNHLPLASERRAVIPGTHHFDVRLQPGADIAGAVLLPDGRPAPGARVTLAGPGRGLPMLRPGAPDLSGNGARTVLTREDGRFRLSQAVGDLRLQIVHPEGCRYLELGDFTGGNLSLEPWSIVAGQVNLGQHRASAPSSVRVALARKIPGHDRAVTPIDFAYTVHLDADLRFRFDRVPPGVLELRVMAPTLGKIKTWTETIQVRPGDHLEIEMQPPP